MTGQLLFIRYCGGCYLGLPVSFYVQGRTQCKRCLARSAAKSAKRTAKEAAEVVPGKWASHATALSLDHAYAPGLCKAESCWAEVQRKGRGPDTQTRPLPLCETHMAVRSSGLSCSAVACAYIGPSASHVCYLFPCLSDSRSRDSVCLCGLPYMYAYSKCTLIAGSVLQAQ